MAKASEREVDEKPILMSAPMVRAILDGRKEVTRRAVKLNEAGRVALAGKEWHPDDPEAVKACPYGQPGDRLWVKETYQRCLKADGHWVYRADDDSLGTCHVKGNGWKPSIFMPRAASRILLDVVAVRLERLHAITEEEAVREGCRAARFPTHYNILIEGGSNTQVVEGFVGGIPKVGDHWQGRGRVEYVQRVESGVIGTARQEFISLWMELNGGESWLANPLVWRVEFRRVPPQGGKVFFL